ncbi:response regulator of citrate/malate metabolism [Desulfosporosinus acidiphilus SJ4]|uniref:Transcriptional regulatory protein n=1 Tax=Desulfosporosinus acidiphilus (strain DSM 22704 / JCM 16185 / SJ4) TaxID=646529 RepID=I4D8G6_DESAJ|nr:response regulator [Desulfosporosinus acidiphilus]AFM42090.1 response regulator of citrate/malate metabolism [Desulfosporosinus acidiphilus SJ4]
MFDVLIVEDDPMVSHVNTKFLKKVPGFNLVGTAANLAEAREYVQKEKIDLILLDLFLPKENGIDFLKWLRSNEIHIDVILITADKRSESVLEAFRFGAVDYLIKPFTFERFKDAMQQYKERADSLLNSIYIEQDALDRYVLPGRAEDETDKPLEKGLSKYTFQRIWNHIVQNGEEYFTADEAAESLGMARVSVRKYLDVMEREGKLELLIEYGKVGRPQHKFKLKDF